MLNRSDKSLVVRCSLGVDGQRDKKITFTPAAKCNYDLLRHKVKQSFSLSSSNYAMQWQDDDGEVWDIQTDEHLAEAVDYFSNGGAEDNTSTFSGFSLSRAKITIRLTIVVESDCISLSDTSSEISFEDHTNHAHDYRSMPYNHSPRHIESVDDDSVTVSSRDTGALSSVNAPSLRSAHDSRDTPSTSSSPHTALSVAARSTAGRLRKIASSLSGRGRSVTDLQASAAARFPENPSAVFERLKYEEYNASDTSSIAGNPLDRNEWLKDQHERAIRTKLGGLPIESDAASLSLDGYSEDEREYSQFSGDLELQSNDHGRQYYSYKPMRSSGGSSMSGDGAGGYESLVDSASLPDINRPTSMQLHWLADQQRPIVHSRSQPEFPSELRSYHGPTPSPPPSEVPECSACGSRMTSFRYICYSCGPKLHQEHNGSDKGKFKERSTDSLGLTYPPSPNLGMPSISPSNSSKTLIGDLDLFNWSRSPQKPLPSIPNVSSSPGSSSGSSQSQYGPGYELCVECIYTDGVTHAKDGPNLLSLPPSPQDLQYNGPITKSKTRHAFLEKTWLHNRWADVEYDIAITSQCSFCNAAHLKKSYKCVTCDLNVCRGCYSQIHDIHPSHAFLVIPERRSYSDPDSIPAISIDRTEEDAMKHQGVKCSHCLQDIVGARFHCLTCESVDICSNCESAGLPGNLDSADGGHTSAHMLIKIPYPIDSSEVHTVSQRAIHLWQSRDGVNFSHSEPELSSAASSYARTVIGGIPGALSRSNLGDLDHGTICRGCNQPIIGIRYQCACCPSKPAPYSLCARCEERSWHVHNPFHVFLKITRPVDKPIELEAPLLSPIYREPVAANFNDLNNPRGYLRNLTHATALCDVCMNRIQGEWHRCVYCGRDLCPECEPNDEHDDTHVSIVIKAPVNMSRFNDVFKDLEPPNRITPIIPYAIYKKQQF